MVKFILLTESANGHISNFTIKIIMGKGKPRHNPDKPANNYDHCPYDDSTLWKECRYPWANRCTGQHSCYKLYLQHLATLSEKDRNAFTEKFGKFEVPRR